MKSRKRLAIIPAKTPIKISSSEVNMRGLRMPYGCGVLPVQPESPPMMTVGMKVDARLER